MSNYLAHHVSSSAAPASPNRHLARRYDGTLCMAVVDPATRKLLIPCGYVYPTRAQQRATIPSLCQLFLQGRCRQSVHCHQVHAALDVVMALREQVESLPWCCVMHGDKDYAGVLEKQSWLSNVVLHIPESSFEGGYIPLSRVGYTHALQKILKEQGTRVEQVSGLNTSADKKVANARAGSVVLSARDQVICRLHIFDRCRYAEDCRFLHVCKQITSKACTCQKQCDENFFLSSDVKSTSIFTSPSLQKQPCEDMMHQSGDELMVRNMSPELWMPTGNSAWTTKAGTPWLSYEPTTTMNFRQSQLSRTSPLLTRAECCGGTVPENSINNSCCSERNRVATGLCPDKIQLISATPYGGTSLNGVTPTTKVSLSSCESNGNAENTPSTAYEHSLTPLPSPLLDISSVQYPAASMNSGCKRYRQHNPYRNTSPFYTCEEGGEGKNIQI